MFQSSAPRLPKEIPLQDKTATRQDSYKTRQLQDRTVTRQDNYKTRQLQNKTATRQDSYKIRLQLQDSTALRYRPDCLEP